MDDDVNELCLAPFQNVMSEATTAMERTEGSEATQTAAEVLREAGKYALGRLEEPCCRRCGYHGSRFLKALRDNGEIKTLRTQLNEHLSLFHQHMTGNALSVDNFAELTAVTRDVGNKVYEAIISMNLDVATVPPPPMVLPPTYRPPVTPPSSAVVRSPISALQGSLPASSPPSSFPDPEDMSEDSQHSGSDEEQEQEEDVLRRQSQIPSRPPLPIPGDFWDAEDVPESSRCPGVEGGVGGEAAALLRSQRLSRPRPPIPRFYHVSEDESDIYINEDPNHNRNNHNNISNSGGGNGGNNSNNYGRYNSDNSSNGTGGNKGSNSGRCSNNGGNRRNRDNGNSDTRVIDSRGDSDDGIDGNPTLPVRRSLPRGQSQSSVAGCAIDGTSSFKLLAGFCQGAGNLVVGAAGVREPKPRWTKVFTGSSMKSKCVACKYEVSSDKIAEDDQLKDTGNLRSEDGIGYRLRFLRKSHVRWRRPDDALYACVFCVNGLRTTDPSDPTVFISSQALLRHVARHSRPLPEVANFIVVEAPKVPAEHHNDYDLHLPGPLPARHTVLGREPQVAGKPTGLATAIARRALFYEHTPDKSHTLEILVGSRVTGLEWPAKYGGEWCSGWHDGTHV